MMVVQIPGGPPLGETGAIAQLLMALAAFVGALSWAVLKVIERKDAKQAGSGGMSNGALARLERVERDVVEAERRANDQIERLREDTQANFADVNRRLDRWDEKWDRLESQRRV